MCQRISCAQCCKPTYAGCGRHVDQVLSDVPPDDRCKCRETRAREGSASSTPSFFERLFGKA